MPNPMSQPTSNRTILRYLAGIYRGSAAGRMAGVARDFTIDYESFLRRIDAADGDARELAERELAMAARESGGCLQIDRQRKSHQPTVIRLSRDGGESWLFGEIGECAPTEERRILADQFRSAAACEVPERWRDGWESWCLALAGHARDGGGVQPFRRGDPEGNAMLLRAIVGVLNWDTPGLVRYASAAITGDSKQLQALEPRLLTALAAITGRTTLAAFGIHSKPRFVTIHGPLTLVYPSATLDCGVMPAPLSLAEPNIVRATGCTTGARLCLIVENEDTFHALAAASPPDVLLLLSSYAGSAVRALLAALPQSLRILHFGDADPAGSDILRDLREKSGRDIRPLPVGYPCDASATAASRPLTAAEKRMLRTLLACDLPDDTRSHLESLQASGRLRAHEQEHIPIPVVLAAIGAAMRG